MYDYVVVGAGLSGAVIAERLAQQKGVKILVVDKRSHVAGNCYDYVDPDTGIRVNEYGAHLFHTNNKTVWEYVKRFCKWQRWEHKVLSYVDNQFVPMPVNITTVNMLCDQNLQTTEDMNQWLKENTKTYSEIRNSEEMAKSRIGVTLYDKLIAPYTIKQWAKDPAELNPEVLARIPIRNNFDTRYFTDKYQALPVDGYTHFVEQLLSHPNITVQLNTEYSNANTQIDTIKPHVVYTGPIDTFYSAKGLPALEYRSILFDKKKIFNINGFYQPNSVVNYPSKDFPFTRIVEYKHFLNQISPHSIIVSETTTSTGEPYYPVLNERNLSLYDKYRKLAEQETNTTFVGRLANYKYFNMDEAISNALDIYENKFAPVETKNAF